MSEPASKPRHMINLDEFERRLGRPAPTPKSGGDPLAELARLGGGAEDRFKGMFQARPATPQRATTERPAAERPVPARPAPARPAAERPAAERPAPARPAPERAAPEDQRFAQYSDANWRANDLRANDPRGNDARGRRPGNDFAAIEAGLRGSIAPRYQAEASPPDYDSPEAAVEEEDDWLDAASYAPAPAAPSAKPVVEPPRSRLPLYATAAIITFGLIGIGASFALKRTPSSPQEIAMIKAATGPVKVPASAASDNDANQTASILDKSPQPNPVAAVNHTEQPVDVAASLPPNTPAPAPMQVAAQTPQATAPAPAAANMPTGAAVVPVPLPPGGTASVQQSADLANMIEPKKVKTVAVHPDGSFGANNDPSSAPPAVSAPPAMAALPSMAGSGAAPAAAAALPPVNEPAKTPPAASASDHNEKVADAAPDSDDNADDAAEPAGKGFAVQLAAPATEAEARQMMGKFQRQFGGLLAGHHIKYRVAKVSNKSVYRVRVNGLSHEGATSLCQKIQAKGGSCFVAKT